MERMTAIYVFMGFCLGFVSGWCWWPIFQKFHPDKPVIPECFGKFRSPQWDAEGDCSECEFDKKCYEKFKTQ